jgi:hypothetical protein
VIQHPVRVTSDTRISGRQLQSPPVTPSLAAARPVPAGPGAHGGRPRLVRVSSPSSESSGSVGLLLARQGLLPPSYPSDSRAGRDPHGPAAVPAPASGPDAYGLVHGGAEEAAPRHGDVRYVRGVAAEDLRDVCA